MLPDIKHMTSDADQPEVEVETVIEKAEREEWRLT